MCFLYRQGNNELTLAYAKFDQANRMAARASEPHPNLATEVADTALKCRKCFTTEQRYYLEGWCDYPMEYPSKMPMSIGFIRDSTERMNQICAIADSISEAYKVPLHSRL